MTLKSPAPVSVSVRTEWRRLPSKEVGKFLSSDNITAGQLFRMEFHSDKINPKAHKIELEVCRSGSLNIACKMCREVTYTSQPNLFLASISSMNDLCFFEAPQAVWTVIDLVDFVEALRRVLNAKTQKPVADVYVPIPEMPDPLTQFLLLPRPCEKRLVELNEFAKPGITSVRVLPKIDTLLGIRVNAGYEGLCIVMMQEPMSKLRYIQNPYAWAQIAIPPGGRRVRSLSRPKLRSEGRINVVVTFTSKEEAMLSLFPESGRYRSSWSDVVPTASKAIGSMSGKSDTYVAFSSGKSGASIELTPSSEAGQVAKDYLQS
ncbi:MAG: hypothetical protein WC787_04565 [Patescibacteria group bacterium]|jgi:hypothetical protein